jgi:hypothetical protein
MSHVVTRCRRRDDGLLAALNRRERVLHLEDRTMEPLAREGLIRRTREGGVNGSR